MVATDPALGLEEIRSVDCRAAADEVLRAEMVSVVELGLLQRSTHDVWVLARTARDKTVEKWNRIVSHY